MTTLDISGWSFFVYASSFFQNRKSYFIAPALARFNHSMGSPARSQEVIFRVPIPIVLGFCKNLEADTLNLDFI
jgi:hypothetical protein